MFERHGVSAYFTAKDATTACYACGRTSGLVIDFGAGGTVINPVQDGLVDLKGIVNNIFSFSSLFMTILVYQRC